MVKCSRAYRFAFRVLCILSGIAAVVVILSGCASLGAAPQKTVTTKTKTELAIESIDMSLLQECNGIGEDKGNQTGNLLQDFTDTAQQLSLCMAWHNALVQYIKPLVIEQRKGTP